MKSLNAKWRDFAESFVFKGLIAFLFRRFPLRTLRTSHRRVTSRDFPRLPIIADNSEKRNDLFSSLALEALADILACEDFGVLTIESRLAIAWAS